MLLALGAGLAGCPSGEAKDPSKTGDKRNTEMTHEPCDLESSSALVHDANADKRPELVRVMDGKREECRAVDLNMDGVIDRFVYYDEQGRVRRTESGFGRDNRPNEISHYQAGVIVRKERETNGDGEIDTWDYYQGGRLTREDRDSNGDGFVDQWWLFQNASRPDCAVVTSDGDGDGKPDEDSRIELCKDGLAAAPPPPPEKAAAAAEGGTSAEEPPAGEKAAPPPDEGKAPSEGKAPPEEGKESHKAGESTDGGTQAGPPSP